MTDKQTPYFVTANSCIGKCNLLDSNLQYLEHIYILKESCSLIHAHILNTIKKTSDEKQSSMECIYSSTHPDELCGLILPEQKIAFLSDTIVPLKIYSKLLNLKLISTKQLFTPFSSKDRSQAEKWISLRDSATASATNELKKAKEIHDNWEKIYISNIDFDKLDVFGDTFTKTLISKPLKNTLGIAKHRFFGGATYRGPVDFVPQLIKNLSRRYFIKGRPGTGKSSFLKKVAAYAQQNGYDIAIYHCGFDPESLDMLTIPALDCCIFDSTAPHEYYPENAKDELLDFYDLFVTPETDETYETELNEITNRYQNYMKEATIYLARVRDYDTHYRNIFQAHFSQEQFKKILESTNIYY